MKQKDFIILLCWPEGMVISAGAWYDKLFSNRGRYRVGHSALALVNSLNNKIYYFDFGRYETPDNYGRIRDSETDPEVQISQLANIKNQKIINIDDILIEIYNNKDYHAKGSVYASIISSVNFSKAFNYAKKWQKKEAIKYGPFVHNGTNCSRFVAKIARRSNPSFIKRLRLKFPFCLSPSPKRNVSIGNLTYYIVRNQKCQTIKRKPLKAYFSGIEIYE